MGTGRTVSSWQVDPELSPLLAPLVEEPGRSAVLCDVDGTIAPIAERADEAAVLDAARQSLAALSRRYALVGCVSGRRVAEARRMVGVGGIAYVGNHGFERMEAGMTETSVSSRLAGHEDEAGDLARAFDTAELRSLRLRIEDKGPIWAFHWRGAPDQEAAEAKAREVAAAAEGQGLIAHWGRKVLEIRPAVAIDKGTAIEDLLDGTAIRHALYAGDDRTDLDAFRTLRALRDAGRLSSAVCVGIASDEVAPELAEAADAVVEGPAGFLPVLRALVTG